jgi:hypothetical protein
MGQIGGLSAQIFAFSALEQWILRFEVGGFLWQYFLWGNRVAATHNLSRTLSNGQIDWVAVFDWVTSLLPTQSATRGPASLTGTNRAYVDGSLRQYDRMTVSAKGGNPPFAPAGGPPSFGGGGPMSPP